MRANEYTIRKFESARAFLDNCLDWLLANGVSDNSLIAVAQSIADGKPDFGRNHWFGTITRREETAGCVIHEQLDGLMSTHLPAGTHDLVADSIVASGLEVRKVYGPEGDSERLATALCKKDSRKWRVTHHWECLAAHSVEWPVSRANGELRKSNYSEQETIEAWADQYAKEKQAPIPVKDFILRKLQDQDLYVWDDGGPKMMLSVSGRTPVCARISAAFTPMEYRGRGYASIAVASLTSHLLAQGHRYTSLMVETDEEHLYRLYQRLGFQKHDSRLNIALA